MGKPITVFTEHTNKLQKLTSRKKRRRDRGKKITACLPEIGFREAVIVSVNLSGARLSDGGKLIVRLIILKVNITGKNLKPLKMKTVFQNRHKLIPLFIDGVF